jgi:hypothetical protein
VSSPHYRIQEDFVPTTKNSLKFATTAFSNVTMGSRVLKGSSLNYNIELGLPYISDSVFLRSEANYKKYFKLKDLKKISHRFRQMNLEFSSNFGFVKGF